VGDFNVAPEPEDVYDPAHLEGQVGFHPDERSALQRFRQWGFIDVFRLHQPGPGHYTFWDYRLKNAVARNLGWRVDHIWATRPLAEKSTRAWIDIDPRLKEKPSDHTFVVAEFKK
jgi:exodeoxyribonuclease-3